MKTLKPWTVILTGIAVSVGAAVAIVVVPWILGSFIYQYSASGQEFWIAIEIVLRVIQTLIVPLGVVLIGSGLVMLYLDQHGITRSEDEAEVATEEGTDGRSGRPARSSSHRFTRGGHDHTP